jgi:hypothetical protein
MTKVATRTAGPSRDADQHMILGYSQSGGSTEQRRDMISSDADQRKIRSCSQNGGTRVQRRDMISSEPGHKETSWCKLLVPLITFCGDILLRFTLGNVPPVCSWFRPKQQHQTKQQNVGSRNTTTNLKTVCVTRVTIFFFYNCYIYNLVVYLTVLSHPHNKEAVHDTSNWAGWQIDLN